MEAGSLLGDTFRIEEPLGEGGMGAVYAARHVRTSKRYAVKVLHPDRAQGSADAVARFKREAAALSGLGHPGIVAIHDFARTEDGIDYLVMDLLAGEDLAQRLKRDGPMSFAKALELLKPIAAALNVAHRAGIVHRDLKPGNIFIVRADGVADRPMILDFGLVKFADHLPDEPLTASGVVMGTPAYLSPEQALGQDLDHRTDIYALATLFYELVTGATPFEATTMTALLLKIMTAPPPALSTRAIVPDHVDAVMSRALSKDLNERFDSATDFAAALEQATQTARDESDPGQLLLPNAPTMQATAAVTPEAVPIAQRPQKKSRLGALLAGVGLLAVVAAGAWYAGSTTSTLTPANREPTTIVTEEVLESPTLVAPSPREEAAPVEAPEVEEVPVVEEALVAEAPDTRMTSPARHPNADRPRRTAMTSPAAAEIPESPEDGVATAMSSLPAPSSVPTTAPTSAPAAAPNPAVAEANRLQVVRYEAQVGEITRLLALLPRIRREFVGLSAGRKPALCDSGVRAQLSDHSDVSVVVSRRQSLRDGIQRVCDPFGQLLDPPPPLRAQIARIDQSLDRAEEMARDRTVSTNTPVAIADDVVTAVRDARAALQGVSGGQRPFPCNDAVFTRLRRLGSAGNTWSGAAANRVVQARDRICRRLGMDAAQLRQREQQFTRQLDDTEGILRQTQRTLQRVADRLRAI
ncbi:MAG: serine/threonine-protein kinase [Polyangiales bacterium]